MEFVRKKSDRNGAAPFEIIDLSIFFTSLCNSGCLTCDIWKEKVRVEFPLEEVAKLVEMPILKDVTFVLLGGEFTIHSHYKEIVKLLHEKEQPYVLLTNGIIPRKIYDLYEQVPVTNISISVDGFGERHDQVRGYPGNFARIQELVRWIKQHHPKTFIRVCYTASQYNSTEDLIQVKAWTEYMGIDLKIGAVTGAAIYATKTESNLKLAEPELYRFESMFPDDKYSQLYRPWKRGWSVPCTGIQHHPVLMQDGELILCQNLGHKLGNIYTTPFDKLWLSEKVQQEILTFQMCNKCWMTCSRKYDAERLSDADVKAARLTWL